MAATTGLFLIMQGLVGGEGEVRIEPDRPRYFPVVQDIIDEPPQRIIRSVQKPPIVKPQPPRTKLVQDTPKPGKLNTGIPRVKTGPNDERNPIDMGLAADGDYMPIVRVSAQYPRRALSQGIEGYAVVELTVGADGAVMPGSISVVDAEPVGIFDKEAQKAAARFKYKPRVINGVAQPVSGVRYRFSFNLGE